MSSVTIYHNPKCGTSRKVLDYIREAGFNPEIVEYLKTPLSLTELTQLVHKMGVPVRSLLREKEPIFVELELGQSKWSEQELLDFMVAHPILMNRPVVVTPLGAKLCRPAEVVFEVL